MIIYDARPYHRIATMSSSSITDPDALRATFEDISLARVPQPLVRVSFWLAITLPFLYFPLLASGLSSSSVSLAFVGLVSLHVVTLVLGHRHRR